MKHGIKSKKGVMALKLDMSKAYDRVEWLYLEKVMTHMSFPAHFVHLIMSYLRSISFSFLINGRAKGFLKPSRGLRQGDAVSSYLFLLCAEGLSTMIRKAAHIGTLHLVKICRGSPTVSHLFFC